jgi:hypothetical protein
LTLGRDMFRLEGCAFGRMAGFDVDALLCVPGGELARLAIRSRGFRWLRGRQRRWWTAAERV